MGLKLRRLEERIVLEAAGADAIDQHDQDHGGDAGCTDPQDAQSSDGSDDGGSSDDPVRVLAVSSQVQDAAILAQAAMEGVLAYVYDASSDSLDDILHDIQEMLGGSQADSIAFASHAPHAGAMELAGQTMSLTSLIADTEGQDFWQDIGQLLETDGRVDLLTCNISSTPEGEAFLSLLRDLTGHDVAASDDPTGNPEDGGDWLLESGGVDLADCYFDPQELASYGGTLSTAWMAVDFNTGFDLLTYEAVEADGTWFVAASSGETGRELFLYDPSSETFTLLKDILPGTESSNVDELYVADDVVYFMADDGTHGTELWRSDGTASGTYMVMDINPGSAGSDPSSFCYFREELFFAAEDGTHGRELWSTNGTQGNGRLVMDINPGISSSSPRELAGVMEFDGTILGLFLYFSANDGSTGRELWTSYTTFDISTAQMSDEVTELHADIRSGEASGNPSQLTAMAGQLVFTADDGISGRELWLAYSQDTRIAKDIYPGGQSSNPSNFTMVNSTLFFTAVDSTVPNKFGTVYREQIWWANSYGTGFLAVGEASAFEYPYDLYTEPDPSYLTAVGNTLYFSAYDDSELWKSDGTASGTVLIDNVLRVSTLVEMGGDVYWWNRFDEPDAIWKSDGSTVEKVVDAHGDSGQLLPIGNMLYYSDEYAGKEVLWQCDGTASGTSPVQDSEYNFSGDVNIFATIGNYVYFTAKDAMNRSMVWKSDGTPLGTTLLSSSWFNTIHTSFELNGRLIFMYNTYQCWSTDGTPSGTVNFFEDQERCTQMVVCDDYAYFIGRDGNEYYLYRTDGTISGTVQLVEVKEPVLFRPFNDCIAEYNGSIYYLDVDYTLTQDFLHLTFEDITYRLMKVNDSGTGAQVVATLPFSQLSHAQLFVVGDRLVMTEIGDLEDAAQWPEDADTQYGPFPVTDFSSGGDAALWVSDGTSEGTYQIHTFSTDSSDAIIKNATIMNGYLYFHYRNGNTLELWRSDGTQIGTNLVKSLGTAGTSTDFSMYQVDSILYFVAGDSTTGAELWRTDGTTDGTFALGDINPGPAGNGVQNPYTFNGELYFTATSASGRELWKTDGTVSGTVMLKDINPGSDSSSPMDFAELNGELFFRADNGVNGFELWKTDGTADGTVLVQDINPGQDSSTPAGMSEVHGNIVFAADDGDHGTELWMYGELAKDDAFVVDNTASSISGNLFDDNGFGEDISPTGNFISMITDVSGATYSPPNFVRPMGLGSLSVSGNGDFTFTFNDKYDYLASDETVTLVFAYTANLTGVEDTALASITIRGANAAPNANADGAGMVYSTDQNTPFTATQSVLANDTDSDGGPLPMHIVGHDFSTLKGIVTLHDDGTFDYDPLTSFRYLEAGETASTTFTYTVSDGWATDTASVTIYVSGTNDAPSALDDNFTTDEDTVLNVAADGVLANDFDPEGHSLTITTPNVTSDQGVAVTLNADGSFSYDPRGVTAISNLTENESLTDTFTYTIADGHGGTDTATVSITVHGINHQPVADDDDFATNADTGFTTSNVLANDSDTDAGDTLSVSEIDTTGTIGTVTNNGDGTFGYDPDGRFDALEEGEIVTDTFTYTVSDGHGGTDTATVTITITGVNDAPDAAEDSYATDEDTSLNVPADGVLANDSDAEGHDFSITGFDATSAQGAAVVLNADGSFSYDPTGATQLQALAGGESIVDTFTYTLTDSEGATGTGTVSITISGVNDDPVAVDDDFSTDEDSSFTTSNVLANDQDPDTSDTLTVIGLNTTGTQGTVKDNGDGTFDYDPGTAFQYLSAGESATDTFTYTMTDGHGQTSTATVTITISGLNDAPDAAGDSYATDEDTALNVPADGVLTNDSDAEGHDFAITGFDATSAQGAAVVLNADGSFSYDPTGAALLQALAVGESIVDTFTYTLTDSEGATGTGTVSITISGVNDDPMAVDDDFSTDEDSSFTTSNVLANDQDPDTSDTLSVTSINLTGTHGTVKDNGDGTFDYDPGTAFQYLADGESATDTFTYTMTDGHGGTSTATVSVTINGVNDAPVAGDDGGSGFTTDEDSSFTTSSVLANDADVDTSDTLAVIDLDTTGTLGTVTDNGDGTFDYDPNGQFESLGAGQTATDTFSYTMSDGRGGTDTATVTVTINGVNDDPVAGDDGGSGFTTDEDSSFTTSSVLANDSDVDGTTLSVDAIDTSATLGTVTDNGDGTFDYDPGTAFQYLAQGETATDTFTYTLSDGQGGTSTATVTITLNGLNDAPIAVDDQGENFTTDEDNAFVTGSVLDNDIDVDGDVLSVLSYDASQVRGILSLNPDGTFSYDPNGLFDRMEGHETATEVFSYVMADSHGAQSTATVTITIQGIRNDTPPPLDPGGLHLSPDDSGPAPHGPGSLVSGFHSQDTMSGFGAILSNALNMLSTRTSPFGPAYPPETGFLATYTGTPDLTVQQFDHAVDAMPGICQHCARTLKTVHAALVEVVYADADAPMAKDALRETVGMLSELIQRITPTEYGHFSQLLHIWLETLQLKLNHYARTDQDLKELLKIIEELQYRLELQATA